MRWRPRVAIAALSLPLVAFPHAASADHCSPDEGDVPDFGFGDEQDEFDVGGGDCGHEGGGGGDPDPGPPSTYILGLDGEPPCWHVIAIRPSHPRYEMAFESFEEAYDAGVFIYDDLATWVAEFAASLPFGGLTETPDLILPCEAVSPDVEAYLAWRDTVVLPPPAGELDPGEEVVTGMDTYLQIGAYQPEWDTDGDPRTVTWTGPIRVVATAEHQVDWGDGTVTPSATSWHATNGRPYMADPPDDATEPIVHVYEDATPGDDVRTITVTTRWTARWETLDGSLGGVVPFFRYSTSTVDLDVDEVQSVVIEQD